MNNMNISNRRPTEVNGLNVPTIVVATLIAAAAYLALPFGAVPSCGAAEVSDRHVELRGALKNSRIQFQREKKGHVAFLGGSITEMDGYRPLVSQWLEKRFSDTEFTFTNAGIASTCSTAGAMRLERDVLSKGPVDLLFVEFAVNDDQDAGHGIWECIQGIEGIVQQTRRHNPAADIVFVYFCNPGIVEAFQSGGIPAQIAAHDGVAWHYGLSTVNVAREVARQITEGSLTWKQYGGTHPGPAGNRLAADMVALLLREAWREDLPADAEKAAHEPPESPVYERSYGNGRFINPAQADADAWTFGKLNWMPLPGRCRERFLEQELLHADKPNANLTLKFKGRAIGAYVLAGPDAGMVEVSIDGGEFSKVDLYHRFSAGLHYPRTVMFHTDLTAGEHTLRLRISESKNEKSKGHAVRILQFAAN